MNRAVFLDRDGTIAVDVNYCCRPEDFIFLPGAIEGIRLLNGAGFKVIVITNQSGIARGYLTEVTLESIHRKMKSELALHGALVDAIYYCPHHPDEGCECRKPKPKLAHQAIVDWDVDCQSSYVVGDRLMDIQLAKGIGCKSVIVDNERGKAELAMGSVHPNYIARDLTTAANWIIADREAMILGRAL